MNHLSTYKADYPQLLNHLPSPSLPWLKQLRTQAFASFINTGFPTSTAEQWRYTNVSALERKNFSALLNTDTHTIERKWLTDFCLADAITVVLVNGRFSPQYSALAGMAGLPNAVTVLSMADALAQKPDLVANYLGKAISYQKHGFVAFNTAWFSDGLFVHLPANTILNKPIQLLHLVTQADYLATSRHILVAEEMAQADIVETFVGANAYLTTSISEVFVGENARLNLYKIQNESDKAYHFGGTYVRQASNSQFNHHNFALGAGALLARSDVYTDLETASQCEFNGLYLGDKRQHIDNNTRINHLKPHTTSRELYKGVLNQRAKGVFQGCVFVAKDAQKTDSKMHNCNLLLSNDAEVDTKPQLEIYADDVSCTHGVTVGQFDEKIIFYLKSRCIDTQTAQNILIFAFANEMITKVGLNSVQTLLLAQLLQRFPQQDTFVKDVKIADC